MNGRMGKGIPCSADRQRGAALVIGLILLMVMTLLAVSGMNTATLELTMAGNTQFSENAFEAAETGIQRAIVAGNFNTLAPVTVGPVAVPTGTVTTVTAFVTETAPPPPPPGVPGIFSMGSAVSAYHFTINSQAAAQRGASSTHMQGFYRVGPSGN